MEVSWQSVGILVGACVSLSLVGLGFFNRRGILAAGPFWLGCLMCALWGVLYAFELEANSLETKLLLMQIQLSFMPFFSLVLFETIHRFIYGRRFFRGWLLIGGCVIPVITVALAWMVHDQTFFRYNFRTQQVGDLLVLRYSHGPWGYVDDIYKNLLCAAAWILLFLSLRRTAPWIRRSRVAAFGALLVPWMLQVAFDLGISPTPGVNYTPLSLIFSGVIVGTLLFSERILVLAPVARTEIMENLTESLVVLDRDKRIVDLNRAAAEVFSCKPEAAYGIDAAVFFSKWKEITGYLEGRMVAGREIRLFADKQVFEITSIPVRGHSGRLQATILRFADISERKEREASINRMREAAEAVAKAQRQFLKLLGSQIRKPMSGVIGSAGLLRHTGLDDHQSELMSLLDANSKSLHHLLDELLDYTQLEGDGMRFAKRPFAFRSCLERVCEDCRIEAAESGVEVRLEVASQVPDRLIGDRERLGQMVRNLLKTAIHLTPEGSIRLEITPGTSFAKSLSQKREIAVCFAVCCPELRLATAAAERLFDPLVSLDEGDPMGLGLAIAQRICVRMGGRIGSAQISKTGTIFSCTLRFEVSTDVEVEHPPRSSMDMQPLRVGILDKNQINRRLLELYLRRENHEVGILEHSAQEEPELLRDHWDLLVVDSETIESSKKFREACEPENSTFPPVVFVSDGRDDDFSEDCPRIEILRTPITEENLRAAMAAALACTERRTRQQPPEGAEG